MKRVMALVLAQAFCTTALCVLPPLEKMGMPIRATNLVVSWRPSNNEIPPTLWVYRTLPAEFSPATISNLLALGSFASRDRIKLTRNPDPRVMFYQSPDQRRTLLVDPQSGTIEYRDNAADRVDVSEGVPREEELLGLATNLLPKLGIGLDQLAKKPNSVEPLAIYRHSESYVEQTNGPPVSHVPTRGIIFIRAVDGIQFTGTGTGGLRIDYGHHGRIAMISLLWRKLVRDKQYPTATSDTFVKWIREGRSFQELHTRLGPLDWRSVKSLTITGAWPFLFGETAEMSQDWTYPFASLGGTADLGWTNVPVHIYCPIITDKPTSAKP